MQKKDKGQSILADAQISKYWSTDKEYLRFSLAKLAFSNPEKGVSVTIGLLVNPQLKGIFHFLKDPKLKCIPPANGVALVIVRLELLLL